MRTLRIFLLALCLGAFAIQALRLDLHEGATVFGLLAMSDGGHYAIARGTFQDCFGAVDCESAICRIFGNSTIIVDAIGIAPMGDGAHCL